MATVQALTSGRARNHVLAECARACWMIQAIHSVKLVFRHLPGIRNPVADALSRAHMNRHYFDLAMKYVTDNGLTLVYPCTYMFTIIPPIFDRSRTQLVGGACRGSADDRQSPGDHPPAPNCGQRAGSILLPVPHGPQDHDRAASLHVDRTHSLTRSHTGNYTEQSVKRQDVHPPIQRRHHRLQRSQSDKGTGRRGPSHHVRFQEEGGGPGRRDKTGTDRHPMDRQWTYGESSGHPPLLGRPPPVRGGATYSEGLRPQAPPHTRRHKHKRPPAHREHQMGQEPPALRPAQAGDALQIKGHSHMPGGPRQTGHGHGAGLTATSTTAGLCGLTPPNAYITYKDGVDQHAEAHWAGPQKLLTTQPPPGICNDSIPRRLLRTRSAALWGLEFTGPPRIHPYQRLKEG